MHALRNFCLFNKLGIIMIKIKLLYKSNSNCKNETENLEIAYLIIQLNRVFPWRKIL